MILQDTLANTRKHMPFDLASQPLRINELSLADVLGAVQTADLPNRQRQELASALRTVGRALDRPHERLKAQWPRVRSAYRRAVGTISASECARPSAWCGRCHPGATPTR